MAPSTGRHGIGIIIGIGIGLSALWGCDDTSSTADPIESDLPASTRDKGIDTSIIVPPDASLDQSNDRLDMTPDTLDARTDQHTMDGPINDAPRMDIAGDQTLDLNHTDRSDAMPDTMMDQGDRQDASECTRFDTTCNGIDDDCDGQIDEDFISQQGDACGHGICAGQIMEICMDGALQALCIGENSPEDETCNNMNTDDDCNGIVDDIQGLDEECAVNGFSPEDNCFNGIQRCLDGRLTCQPLFTETEICDDLDNDCNGIVDDIADSTCGDSDRGILDNGIPDAAIDADFTDIEIPDTGIIDVLPIDAQPADIALDQTIDALPIDALPADAAIDMAPICIPSLEICDGLDNDCDEIIDNGEFPMHNLIDQNIVFYMPGLWNTLITSNENTTIALDISAIMLVPQDQVIQDMSTITFCNGTHIFPMPPPALVPRCDNQSVDLGCASHLDIVSNLSRLEHFPENEDDDYNPARYTIGMDIMRGNNALPGYMEASARIYDASQDDRDDHYRAALEIRLDAANCTYFFSVAACDHMNQ